MKKAYLRSFNAVGLPLLILTMGMGGRAVAATVGFSGIIPGLPIYRTRIVSMREQRFTGMVRQHTDFSCGAAALATILRYAYDRPVTEDSVLAGLFRVSNPDVVRRVGFSLLDIKHYVETLGYRGRGYRVKLADLKHVRIPTIVLLDIRGYKHFVVLRRVLDDRYYIADPSLGNRVMSQDAFAKAWNGIIFAVIGPGFEGDTSLRIPVGPPTVKRFGLGAPLSDAELYEFGFTQADLF